MSERIPPENQNQIDLRDKAVEEATGGNGPKASRFLTSDQDPQKIKEREEKEKTQRLLRMAAELASPEQVARLYVMLDDFQQRLDQAFADLEDWREDLESRTVRLEDGTAIYRMEDGHFCTADGQIIPDSDLPDDIPIDAVELKEYEAFQKASKMLADMQDNVVDPTREELQSDDLAKERAEQLEQRLKDADRTLDRGIDAPNQEQSEPRLSETITPSALQSAPKI